MMLRRESERAELEFRFDALTLLINSLSQSVLCPLDDAEDKRGIKINWQLQ